MAMILTGYAVTWDDVAEVDGHRERIAPGAFKYARKKSLRIAHGSAGAAVAWGCRVAEDQHGVAGHALGRGEIPHRVVGPEQVRVSVDDVEARHAALPGSWFRGTW